MARITVREAISPGGSGKKWKPIPACSLWARKSVCGGGTYAVTKGFYDHFGPKRVKDTPHRRSGYCRRGHSVLRWTGTRPVAELMTINFGAFSAMDHIVNEAAKLHYMFGGQFILPMVIRAVRRRWTSTRGDAFPQTPDAIFAHFPGLKVVAPGTPGGCQGIVEGSHSK